MVLGARAAFGLLFFHTKNTRETEKQHNKCILYMV